MHKEERPADPGDRRRHMQPADERRTPFPGEGFEAPPLSRPPSRPKTGATIGHDSGALALWVGRTHQCYASRGFSPPTIFAGTKIAVAAASPTRPPGCDKHSLFSLLGREKEGMEAFRPECIPVPVPGPKPLLA